MPLGFDQLDLFKADFNYNANSDYWINYVNLSPPRNIIQTKFLEWEVSGVVQTATQLGSVNTVETANVVETVMGELSVTGVTIPSSDEEFTQLAETVETVLSDGENPMLHLVLRPL